MNRNFNPITELRRRRRISQDALATALDLPVRVVRALEMNGRAVPPETLERIDGEVLRWLRGSPAFIEMPDVEPLPSLRLFDEDEEGGGGA